MAARSYKSKTGTCATTTRNMTNYFDAPPEGALAVTFERPLSVEYRACKIAEVTAKYATDAELPGYVDECKLGFQFYDKDLKTKIPLSEFTFVILATYSGVSGYDAESKTDYWSNRVQNSRNEEMIVYRSGDKAPFAKGFYGKGGYVGAAKLPAAAHYTKFVRAYCIQLDRVIEIALNASAERGMQKAVAATGAAKSWEKVFILGIADNDHFWGFHLTGYNRETKDGETYAGKGELYFSPVFHAGNVNPVKQPDLHAKCVQLQNAERASHEAYKAKYAHADAPVATTSEPAYSYTTEPVNTNVQPNHAAVNSGFQTTAQSAPAHHAAGGFPETEAASDDLPF